MDRYFIARQYHSKIKLTFPFRKFFNLIRLRTKESQNEPLERKAEPCARIARSRGVKVRNIPEFVARHKLMGRSLEELAAMYPDLWERHEINR
jgi:hypothetical protein